MTDRTALAEHSFERLAEKRGDITQQVLERYYCTHPGARESFQHHGLDNVAELEGRMVSETIFMLLQWVSDRSGTKISQGTTICHHQDALEIGPRWYIGMIDAVLEVLFETLPPGADTEHAMWLEVRSEIAAFIDGLRSEFIRDDQTGPLPTFSPASNA